MKIWSQSFADGERIPEKYAFGKYDAASNVALSENINPHIAWDDLPEGTKSLVLICHDDKVPSVGDDVNQAGRTVPASLPRVDFFHWVLVDLVPDGPPIEEGEFSHGVTPRGKAGPQAPRDARRGVNNYTQWFAGDPDMAGDYYGYDGPCPPWNDEVVHVYYFTLYALDVPRCPLEGSFDGPDVLKAIQKHILGQASFSGTYAIYPQAK